jgi:hypothetical protein
MILMMSTLTCTRASNAPGYVYVGSMKWMPEALLSCNKHGSEGGLHNSRLVHL